MTNEHAFSVRRVDWQRDNRALRQIRESVFIREQSVPEALEWDGLDSTAIHYLAVDDRETPIGTVRLLPDGHIGRMAVVANWRNQGVGSALLDAALAAARECGLDGVFLDAQTHAVSFYERHGFRAEGETFLDAGIPHRHMTRKR